MSEWSKWGECNNGAQKRERTVTKEGNVRKPSTAQLQECSKPVLPGINNALIESSAVV